MAGTVKHARMESQSARARLKRGRQPHWQALVEGRVHLGWQCWKGDPVGRWLLRRYIGNNKYRVQALGRADDAAPADGADVLSFAQAEAKARAMVASPEAQRQRHDRAAHGAAGDGPLRRLQAAQGPAGRRPHQPQQRAHSARAWRSRGQRAHRRAVAPLAGHHGRRPGAAPPQRQQAAVPSRANHRRGNSPAPRQCQSGADDAQGSAQPRLRRRAT